MPRSTLVSAGVSEILTRREVVLSDHFLLEMPEVIVEVEMMRWRLRDLEWDGGPAYPISSRTVINREAINLIAAMLQEHIIEKAIHDIDVVFFDAERRMPSPQDFLFEGERFELLFNFNWDLLHARGISSHRSFYSVSGEFFDRVKALLDELDS